MLRTDTRIIKSGGNRINRSDLAVLVLAEIRFHAVEDSELTRINGGCCLERVDTSAGSFASYEIYAFIFDVVIERTDGIRTAAAASKDIIRKAAFLLKCLGLGLTGETAWKSLTIVGNG